MTFFIIQRVLSSVTVLIGVTIMVFTFSYLIPADPAAAIAGEYASEEIIENIREQLGLNRTIVEQYFIYIRGLVQGDLGYSYYYQRPVLLDLAQRLPASLELAIFSLMIAIPLGVILGISAAVKAGQWLDFLSRIASVFAMSFPVFWFAMVLQFFFSARLGLFPSVGRFGHTLTPPTSITSLYLVDSLLTWNLPAFSMALSHIALPAIALGTRSILMITRMTRSSILEVMKADFVRTARAKGLSERVVFYKHVLRNSLIPIITVIGLQMGYLIAWVFLVEVVFSWPGIGIYGVRAILGQDFPAMMGVTLLVSTIYVIINTVIDLLYVFVDPRIQYT